MVAEYFRIGHFRAPFDAIAHLDRAMEMFIDPSRTWDGHPFILSHIYLLTACAAPVWLSLVSKFSLEFMNFQEVKSAFHGLGRHLNRCRRFDGFVGW